MAVIRVLEYVDAQARSPFAAWFDGLNAPAAAKITAVLYQLTTGNWSSVKGVGAGVLERKIDWAGLPDLFPRMVTRLWFY